MFDHGAALARNISGADREERLKTKHRYHTVANLAQRARSAFYRERDDPRPLDTLATFLAFAGIAPHAAQN